MKKSSQTTYCYALLVKMGLTLTPAQPSLSPLVVGQHSTAKFKKNRLKQINALFGAAGATSVVLQILEEVEISCQ